MVVVGSPRTVARQLHVVLYVVVVVVVVAIVLAAVYSSTVVPL